MNIETVSNNGYNIAQLQGAFTVGALSSVTPVLSSLIEDYPGNALVIDLSEVESIDHSSIRLITNIKKKLESSHQKLYLLNPNDTLQAQSASVPTASDVTIIENISELQQNVNDATYQRYLPYTTSENGYLRLNATCGICGSNNVFGYLLEKNNYEWGWIKNEFFPTCNLQNGESFDYFGSLPIVCADCLTASIEIDHFNLVDADNNVRHHSKLNDQTKLFLSKTTKKRKKLLEEYDTIIGDTFFQCPRSRPIALSCYLLAESCARIAVANHQGVSMFTVGYLNYIALLFAEKTSKTELIDNCRTWLTQVLTESDQYNHVQLAQSHFIIFIASLSLGKYKDLSKIMENYSTLIEQIGNVGDTANNLNSPMFWYQHAETIWKEEINKKSSAIVI